MLIERPQWLIGIIASLFILLGTAFAVVTTGSTLLVRGDRVTVEFTDASALETGNFVFVSGVRAGTVTAVEQIPRAQEDEFADLGPIVLVEAALTTDAQIPADTRVEIILSNTLGKRGLAFMPVDNSPEHLAVVGALEPGDTVPLSRTSTLTDLPEFGDNTTTLLEELDVEALRELTASLADVTQDQRGNVDRLLAGVQDLADVLVSRRAQLARALERADALVDVAESVDDEVLEIIDSFSVTLDTLLAKQDQIEQLLIETADTSTATADFVTERRAQIDRVVADLTEALDVVDANQVNVAHVLPYLSVGLEGFASIGYLNHGKEDTGQWGNVFVTGLGQLGVEATLGCGSPVDEALTTLIGPDPACDGTTQIEPPPDSGATASTPSSAPTEPGALDHVFRTPLNLESLTDDLPDLLGGGQ